MKILVIEDKQSLADVVAERLKTEGYDVDIAYDGLEGFYYASNGSYDLIVLDIMLPGVDGFKVLSDLRNKGIKSKVIILSAKSSLADKLKGLNNGADDYLTKPFHLDELLARIALQLKDKSGGDKGILVFKDLKLDINNSSLQCIKTKESVDLVKKELEVIQFLINNKDQILSRQQIYDRVWGVENERESNNLEVYLSFIRRKLKAIGSDVNIKSYRGLGYKLEDVNEKTSK